ncbi:hypothetical protein BHE74_00052246 [Ensete ventricosum]|nr:hypothetical protein BHE74_00052246 [Ensete ventricosum]
MIILNILSFRLQLNLFLQPEKPGLGRRVDEEEILLQTGFLRCSFVIVSSRIIWFVQSSKAGNMVDLGKLFGSKGSVVR